MSGSQRPYLPTHVGELDSTGSDIGLVPLTTRNTSLIILEQDPAANRGELWIQASTPDDLEGIKKTSVNVLLRIQGQLSKCRLTKAGEGMKADIFNGLDKVADVLLTVLRAHRDAASGITHILSLPPQRNVVPVVEGHLKAAWTSIEKASDEFDGLRKAILKQSQSLREEAEVTPGFLRRQAHKAVNHELPGKSSYPSLCVAMTSLVFNAADAPDIVKRVPGAVVTTNILGVLAFIFGAAMQVTKHIGDDAAIYEPKARETTKKALDCIHGHLLQFCRMLTSLQLYWNNVHSTQIESVDPSDEEELLHILELLEKHVDDCLELVTAIQNLSLPMTLSPTQLDIDDERNGITHGTFGLPSGLY